MNLPLMLDVALSLIFAYLLAATLSSAVNETIAGLLKLRGVYLTKAIEAMTSLGSSNAFDWDGVGGWLKGHLWQSAPMVTHSADQTAMAAAAAAKTAAAVVGATGAAVVAAATGVANFTADLPGVAGRLNQAATAGATADQIVAMVGSIGAVANLQSHPLLTGNSTTLPSYVPARDFSNALLGVLKDGSAAAPFVQANNIIATLPDGPLKTILQGFVSAGADDIDKLRARIESWFDDVMDRVGGIYKRYSQYVMIVLGLLIAVIFNVDSVHMAQTLWTQPELSKVIADNASAYSTAQTKNCAQRTASDPATAAPATAPQAPPQEKTTTAPAPKCWQEGIDQSAALLTQQQLPIGRKPGAGFFGWVPPAHAAAPAPVAGQTAAPAPATGQPEPSPPAEWIVMTILGWFITAVAVSLGAQFWFGMLTEVGGLRAAGTKPARSDASN